MHFFDSIIIGIYVITLIYIGFNRTKKSRSSPEEYLLMGRRLSLPGFVASLVATWYGGILGLGENTYLYGVQTWFILAMPYYVFGIIFAFFLAKKISVQKFISIPDHFHNYYGNTAGIISALFILIIASPAPYILSLSILLQMFTNISFSWSLILSIVISLSYIWSGGLKSIIRTDIFQFILMYSGFIILLIFCWIEYGSPIQLIDKLAPIHLDPLGGMEPQYILVWFFIAMWTFIDPGFYQRCSAVKSPETAKKGVLISILFWFIFDILTITTGLYAKAAMEVSSPLYTFPLLGNEILPPIFFGLFIVAILSTIMSTVDSLGFISAITFGRDIMWRIKTSSIISSKKAVEDSTYFVQQGLFVMGFLALLLAITIPSVVQLWYVTGSIIVPGLLIPFLVTFHNQRNLPKNIIQLMVHPVLVAVVWFIMGNITGGYPLGLEPFYPGLLTSLIIYLLNIKYGIRDRT